MDSNLFSPQSVAELTAAMQTQFPKAIWETFYVTVLSTAFALVLGLPLGVLLVAGDKDGILPLPGWLMHLLNIIINILRSVPFLILMICVFPLTRALVGTTVGTKATIVPLVVAAFPFVARLVETSLRELDEGVVEAAQSMGATPFQIITKVMIPECLPGLISSMTTALTTILGYSAMSGIIGGGGLGKIAIDYGYYRYKYLVMLVAVILLVLDLLLAILFSRWFTNPIRKLSNGAQEIASGNYDVQIKVERHDEIGRLAEDFNHMAAEVKRSAQLEKDILANVSHDLRTPLTLIRATPRRCAT